MSRSGQMYVAATAGTEYTIYAVMRRLGLPLTEEQARFQAWLESKYPPIIDEKVNAEGA